jgi:hypothetical protein
MKLADPFQNRRLRKTLGGVNKVEDKNLDALKMPTRSYQNASSSITQRRCASLKVLRTLRNK